MLHGQELQIWSERIISRKDAKNAKDFLEFFASLAVWREEKGARGAPYF